MKSLLLAEDTHDIFLDINNNLAVTTSDTQAIVQNIKTRLLLIKGESKDFPLEGIDPFLIVGDKSTEETRKAEILSVLQSDSNIISIDKIDFNYDKQNKQGGFTITLKITSEPDAIILEI